MVFGLVLESSFGLMGVLIGSKVFLVMRWMISGSLVVEVSSWGFFLMATSSHVGVSWMG
jgi:hypothetical protein